MFYLIYLIKNGGSMKICDRPEFKSKKPPLTFRENDLVMSLVKAMSKDNFGSVVILNTKGKILE